MAASEYDRGTRAVNGPNFKHQVGYRHLESTSNKEAGKQKSAYCRLSREKLKTGTPGVYKYLNKSHKDTKKKCVGRGDEERWVEGSCGSMITS